MTDSRPEGKTDYRTDYDDLAAARDFAIPATIISKPATNRPS
jgi:hypothetical protein